MAKVKLSAIIIITLLISACGFYIPYQHSGINTIVNGSQNLFIDELTKHFDSTAKKTLTIEVGEEVQKKRIVSYELDYDNNSYMLTLHVPIKVFKNKKLLLSKTLTSSIHLNVIQASSQADTLQIQESYEQLRRTMVKNLLRQLSKFNEN